MTPKGIVIEVDLLLGIDAEEADRKLQKIFGIEKKHGVIPLLRFFFQNKSVKDFKEIKSLLPEWACIRKFFTTEQLTENKELWFYYGGAITANKTESK